VDWMPIQCRTNWRRVRGVRAVKGLLIYIFFLEKRMHQYYQEAPISKLASNTGRNLTFAYVDLSSRLPMAKHQRIFPSMPTKLKK